MLRRCLYGLIDDSIVEVGVVRQLKACFVDLRPRHRRYIAPAVRLLLSMDRLCCIGVTGDLVAPAVRLVVFVRSYGLVCFGQVIDILTRPMLVLRCRSTLLEWMDVATSLNGMLRLAFVVDSLVVDCFSVVVALLATVDEDVVFLWLLL